MHVRLHSGNKMMIYDIQDSTLFFIIVLQALLWVSWALKLKATSYVSLLFANARSNANKSPAMDWSYAFNGTFVTSPSHPMVNTIPVGITLIKKDVVTILNISDAFRWWMDQNVLKRICCYLVYKIVLSRVRAPAYSRPFSLSWFHCSWHPSSADEFLLKFYS